MLYFSDLQKRISLFYFILFICIVSFSQNFTPESTNPLYEEWRWSSFHELNDKGIRCLIEGENNSMWFGTSKGVVLYDGIEWIYYNKESEILQKPVYGLCLSKNKVLYMDHFWIWNCGAMVISIRRFMARPASVALDASGRMDP